MKKQKIEIKDSGNIVIGDEVIGFLYGETLNLHADKSRAAGSLKNRFARSGKKVKEIVYFGEKSAVKEDDLETKTDDNSSQKTSCEEECPVALPQMGDKDPDVLAWRLKHEPEAVSEKLKLIWEYSSEDLIEAKKQLLNPVI